MDDTRAEKQNANGLESMVTNVATSTCLPATILEGQDAKAGHKKGTCIAASP
jgi:hypothetical protein